MRLLAFGLGALLVLVHLELWFGRGGLPHVLGLQAQLEARKQANARARARNEQLTAEVIDLRQGLEMVEEKARAELGMLQRDEILVQVAPRH